MFSEKGHVEYIANGCGAQSILLCVLSGQGKIPARHWITADTGEENYRRLNTGEIISTAEYHRQVVVPLAKKYGCEAHFVRAVDKSGVPLPSIMEYHRDLLERGLIKAFKMPLFGSRGGRLTQVCTHRWKITAINQQLRRLGARTARGAQGIHLDEAVRRVKGQPAGTFQFAGRTYTQYKTFAGRKRFYLPEYGTDLYDQLGGRAEIGKLPKELRALIRRSVKEGAGTIENVPTVAQWLWHYYPLVDLRAGRDQARYAADKLRIPYLISTECDCCPHKDLSRWLHTPANVIEELEAFESLIVNDEGLRFYFTIECVPLRQAIENMKRRAIAAGLDPYSDAADFGCGNAVCGV